MPDPEMAGRNREVFEMIWAALALVLDDGTTAQIATPREEPHLAMGPLSEDYDGQAIDE